MLLITYIFAVLLGATYAFKRLVNDPDRDKYWGPSVSQAQFTKMEQEIALLKSQLEEYKNFGTTFEREASREESIA